MSTFLVILTKMKTLFLYVTTNICYNSAKPYMINQRGHLINKKKLGQDEIMGNIWSINPLLAITHKTDCSFSIMCSNRITNHAFSRIEDYVNVLIERDMAYCCRWI